MWLSSRQKGDSFVVNLPGDRKKKRTINGLTIFAVLLFALGVYMSLIKTADAQTSTPKVLTEVLRPVSSPPPSANSSAGVATKSAAQAATSASMAITPNQAVVTTNQAPNCVPDTSYNLPSALAATSPGLHLTIDTPSTYSVYGNTTTAINSQINDCTPIHSTGTNGSPGNYAASTAVTLNWSIAYNESPSGMCSVTSVSVSPHINQVFPNWVATSGSPSSLSGQWQAYVAKLHAYEAGHAAIDEQEGQSLYNNLITMPATACLTINQNAQAIAAHNSAEYNAANSAYDVDNQFGLKQDVIL